VVFSAPATAPRPPQAAEETLMLDHDRIRHDFKNQLGIIRGFAELLVAEAPPGDPRRGDLEEIHKAAVKALELLASLYPDRDSASQPS
jgi:hypothetical protein